MRRFFTLALALAAAAVPACAQRHSGITSPPTAPPPPQAAPPAPAPIVAVSSGMGPLQFVQANAGMISIAVESADGTPTTVDLGSPAAQAIWMVAQ